MRGQYVIDGIGGRMESMVKAVKISARNNVAEVEDHLDSPEKVFDTLEHELRLNNEYIGFAAAFIPDYYPSQGRWFEPYVRLADSTHIERKQIGSAQHDYFVQEWYVMGMHDETGEGYLSDWTFSEQETDIAPGSIVFLYTDGLTEAENARPEQFGRQRVIENVSSSIAEAYSPKELIETMTAAVRQFVGETEQSDDLTMLAIKYLCSHS